MLLGLALNLRPQAQRSQRQLVNYLGLQKCDTVPGKVGGYGHRDTVFMLQHINAIIVGLGSS